MDQARALRLYRCDRRGLPQGDCRNHRGALASPAVLDQSRTARLENLDRRVTAAQPLLSVEQLSKSYGGVHAVRGVSFSLRAGEILALIGPNGAGKSTCFNMLNGQNVPGGGRITPFGEDTARR